MVKDIKESEFDQSISSGKVVVDCYAPWCGPCRMLSPIIDEISKEIDSYSFYKLNVDDCEDIAREYTIMSIPALLIFEDGELKNKLIGFKTKEELKEILK